VNLQTGRYTVLRRLSVIYSTTSLVMQSQLEPTSVCPWLLRSENAIIAC